MNFEIIWQNAGLNNLQKFFPIFILFLKVFFLFLYFYIIGIIGIIIFPHIFAAFGQHFFIKYLFSLIFY
jgi:hypothetical protein